MEIVGALTDAIFEYFLRRHALWQRREMGGNVPDQPVCPSASGRIGIFHDQRQRVRRG